MSAVSTENEQENNKNVADLEEKKKRLEKLIKESQKELKAIKIKQKSEKSKIGNKKKFKCDKCGNTLSTKRQLESHKKMFVVRIHGHATYAMKNLQVEVI